MTSFETLLTDVSGQVATIWLNRPERRNAFSPVMTRELGDTFNRSSVADQLAPDADHIDPRRMRTPVIAAMNGSAVGMGLTLPLPAAQDFARDLAVGTSAVSVAATKALVYDGLEQDLAASHEREHEVFRWMGRQADAAEGVTAFLQKRPPQWPPSKVKDYPPML
jgi:enoyl-CoA hydratase/carnithine racemase